MNSILTEGKNVHMTHVEDFMFNTGSPGATDAINMMAGVLEMLSGSTNKNVNVTVKWDGSPSLVAGIDPETKKFFVGSKSVFNKSPKLNFTQEDITRNHGASPGLADKLRVALMQLPKLGIKTILQGDMMFTADSLQTKTIGGEEMLTFTPNTITYAFPSNSLAAKKVQAAKMGIIFHTEYTGSSIPTLKASYKPDVSRLRKVSSVWYDDATFRDLSGSAVFSSSESTRLQKQLDQARKLVAPLEKVLDTLYKDAAFVVLLSTYVNDQIRGGTTKLTPDSFIAWLMARRQKEQDAAKTGTGEETIRNKYDHYMRTIRASNTMFNQIFELHQLLTAIKIQLVRKLEKVKGIGTFLPDAHGYRVTTPEGFVAIDHVGKALKLVDRLEFSAANFSNTMRAFGVTR